MNACIDTGHPKDRRRYGSTPDDREQECCLPGIEQEDREWGVGPRYEERDIGVIDPSPKRFRRVAPFDAVVEGARGEEEARGEGQDPERQSSTEFVGDGHQSQPRHEGEGGHDQVDDPAKLGFGYFCGKGGWPAHSGILSPASPDLRRVARVGREPRGRGHFDPQSVIPLPSRSCSRGLLEIRGRFVAETRSRKK